MINLSRKSEPLVMKATDSEDINAWWEEMPWERFWLRVADPRAHDDCVAAPCGDGKHPQSWRRKLVHHVKDGDVVFHYDSVKRAIVGWSTAHGSVDKKSVLWPTGGDVVGSQRIRLEPRTSWAIGLRPTVDLDPVVRADQIARVQWDLFDSLRALEDKVGDPIHYPFEMGNMEETRPLHGYVFKLPAVFVDCFSQLARVAEGMEWSIAPARERAAASFQGAPLRVKTAP